MRGPSLLVLASWKTKEPSPSLVPAQLQFSPSAQPKERFAGTETFPSGSITRQFGPVTAYTVGVGEGVRETQRPVAPSQKDCRAITKPGPQAPSTGAPQRARDPETSSQQSLAPGVGVAVAVEVAVGVDVGVRVTVGVRVAVAVDVGVGVEVAVGVGVKVAQFPRSQAAPNTIVPEHSLSAVCRQMGKGSIST